MTSIVANREREEALARLYNVETTLIWLRRIAMIGWGGVISWGKIPFGLNYTWVAFICSVAYCEILHACVRKQKYLGVLTWISAIGDSILIYLMCFALGKSSSLLVPFFYFSILAAAFRFGSKKSDVILIINTLLALALFVQEDPETRSEKHLTFVLLYIWYSYIFGVMLADWAISNLRRALQKTEELEKERDRSQELLRALINTQEEERKKLAGDLHDRMGERLFSINYSLDECLRRVTDDDLRSMLEASRVQLLSCTSYVRAFMNELRPTVLDELGLCEAISEYVALLRPTLPFTLTTEHDPSLRTWRSREDAMLFRLVQEALLNIRKHAEAKSASIALRKLGDDVTLVIEDDGKGFDTLQVPIGHFGLMAMRERAEVSGGDLSIASRMGGGTRISVTFRSHG